MVFDKTFPSKVKSCYGVKDDESGMFLGSLVNLNQLKEMLKISLKN